MSCKEFGATAFQGNNKYNYKTSLICYGYNYINIKWRIGNENPLPPNRCREETLKMSS